MKKAIATRITMGDDGWQTFITYDDGSEVVIKQGDKKPEPPRQASVGRQKWVIGLASELVVEAVKASGMPVETAQLAMRAVEVANAVQVYSECIPCEDAAIRPSDVEELIEIARLGHALATSVVVTGNAQDFKNSLLVRLAKLPPRLHDMVHDD